VAAHLSLGKKGENMAVEFLLANHYRIIEQNYKAKKYEIDIIALKEGILVFVEVKTRATNRFGEPEESVGYQKENHIATAAEHFMGHFEEDFTDVRYDIISIILNDSFSRIKHIEEAFFPKGF